MTIRTAVRATALVAALALVAPIGLALAQQQENPAQVAQQGRQLVADGKHEEAIEAMTSAMEQWPEYAALYYNRGFAYGNLDRHQEAQRDFTKAAQLAPDWGDALRMSAIASYFAGDMELAWDYAIRAHQSGADASAAFDMLEQAGDAPDDLDTRLEAARIWVDEIEVEGLVARYDNPFGRAVDTSNGPPTTDVSTQGDPRSDNRSTSLATGVGNRILAESQADLNQLLRQTRLSISQSAHFGLVPRQDMARYVLQIEIEDMGQNAPKWLEGYISLYDARSGEQVYRRILELRNISSVADLHGDLERYMDYLEEWTREQGG